MKIGEICTVFKRIMPELIIRRRHIPIIEELLNPLSAEITSVQSQIFGRSKKDLDYANGQLSLSEQTGSQCTFGISGERRRDIILFQDGILIYSFF